MPGGDRLLQHEQEIERRKEEALLNLPGELGETQLLVQQLQDDVCDLQDRIRHDNSWQSKIKDFVIGGIIGAIFGIALSLLFLSN